MEDNSKDGVSLDTKKNVTALPVDLQVAIKHAKRQYKPVKIKKITDFTISDGIMSFIPDPSADETWAVGGQILLCDPSPEKEMGIINSGEIQEYDPDTGMIFIDAPNLKVTDISELKLLYKPFDFAEALSKAYGRLENFPKLLSDVLLKVQGKFENQNISKYVSETEKNLSRVFANAEEGGAIFSFNEADALFSRRSEVQDSHDHPANNEPESRKRQTPKKDRRGIQDIWDMPWALLWGPPGTGKTQSVADAVAGHIAAGYKEKILIVTPTNIAADEAAYRICENLSGMNKLNTDKGCLVYRGGRGAGRRLRRTYPECLRDSAYARVYDAKSQIIEDLIEHRTEAQFKKDYALAGKINKEIQCARATLPDETMFTVTKGYAKVIILTTFRAFQLVGLGEIPKLVGKVIVDEAGMVSRITTAAMATIGQSVLLAGDPKQIGPIYSLPPGTTREIYTWLMASGLSHLTGAMESLKQRHVGFLDLQYRMHPEISKAVSEFTYDGILKDGNKAKALELEPPVSPKLPKARAACIVLDWICRTSDEVYARKATHGVGSEREFSAQIAMGLAHEACENGAGVLILTPYRAQVRLLRKKLKAIDKGKRRRISVGTIHRHQGAERDVVILDTVKGALSWSAPEIEMILNVAISRSKKHFILLASQAEMLSPVLGRLARLLKMCTLDVPVYDEKGQQELLPVKQVSSLTLVKGALFGKGPAQLAKTLGEEIENAIRTIVVSQEQKKIIEKNIGEGHYLVRGVAGSGKSLILAHWAIRTLQKNPKARILVTYFNRGIKNLLEYMLDEACQQNWMKGFKVKQQIRVVHVDAIPETSEQYDAVFVDEAQDLKPDQIVRIFSLCKESEKDGRKMRNFLLFHDDSQNIYGRKTIEEFKAELEKSTELGQRDFADRLSFAGRSFVLRETYRSTQAILGFAINMALDPKHIHSKTESGLLEFMRVPELTKAKLLIRPEDSENGIYEIRYAERRGTAPIVIECERSGMLKRLVQEIKQLLEVEDVSPGSIMVVTTHKPILIANELNGAGIKARAYGGKDGENPINLPATKPDHVRCVTLLSCKGHEAPIVMFAGINDIEDLEWMNAVPKDMLEKSKRCMLYVGMTRAMVRLYVFGEKSGFLDAAKEYAGQDSMIRVLA